LNACPYRATEILHRRPLIVEFYRHDNYSDEAGMSRSAAPRLNWAACQKQSANRSSNSATHTPSPSWLSVSRGQRASCFLARSCLATLA
jgi:hypothetical protein